VRSTQFLPCIFVFFCAVICDLFFCVFLHFYAVMEFAQYFVFPTALAFGLAFSASMICTRVSSEIFGGLPCRSGMFAILANLRTLLGHIPACRAAAAAFGLAFSASMIWVCCAIGHFFNPVLLTAIFAFFAHRSTVVGAVPVSLAAARAFGLALRASMICVCCAFGITP
jgi:hypothetical protein